MNKAKYTQRAKHSDEVHLDFDDKVKAKKNLGQHFLTDLSVAERIADTLADFHDLPCLEVGPGMGVLTQFLIQNPAYETSAIEIDRESVAYLRDRFRNELDHNFRLIEGDFLKLNLNELYPEGQFCVIGNYPYNISSQIFFKVLDYKDRIPVCSGMIQKEVAERLAAKPGCKAYGILTVLMQAYYDIEYLFTVHEFVFDPPPKVKSAVIRLTRNDVTSLECDEKLFVRVVKAGFNQRRKTLRNALRSADLPIEAVDDQVLGKRAEQLSVAEFIALTKTIQSCL
jgi:16S rRNA (adenine1518-N6/adenine1519-N6)-dimethyltransferase